MNGSENSRLESDAARDTSAENRLSSSDLIAELIRLRSELLHLKKIERSREALSRAIYHDLKAPINTIISCIDVVFEGTLGKINPDQKEFLKKAENGLYRLFSYIERLLEISKIESGLFDRKPDDILIGEVLAPMVGNFRIQAAEKKLNLILHIESGLPSIRIDRSSLEHVFQNLISNAVKYTPEGGEIMVAAALEGGRLAVEVRDTGVGISEKDMPYIYDPFHRCKSAEGVKQNGTGLGLSITKMIVDACGGELEAESKPGKGSSFKFSYPVHPGDQTA